MRRRPSPLIAILCALFLLGAQQAAYANFIGHLGIPTETKWHEGSDAEHGDRFIAARPSRSTNCDELLTNHKWQPSSNSSCSPPPVKIGWRFHE